MALQRLYHACTTVDHVSLQLAFPVSCNKTSIIMFAIVMYVSWHIHVCIHVLTHVHDVCAPMHALPIDIQGVCILKNVIANCRYINR